MTPLGSAGVLFAGIIMLTTKFYLADPLISIGLALFMIPRAWSIIKTAVDILMEGVPAHLSHEEVKKAGPTNKGCNRCVWTTYMDYHFGHECIVCPCCRNRLY